MGLSFSISPSNEYSELIVIKIDWFDLIAVQGATQFERVNSLVLSLHYDRILQPYLTIEKITALTIWTFVGKMMSLLFNTLSRFVIVFLLRSLVAQLVKNPPAMQETEV